MTAAALLGTVGRANRLVQRKPQPNCQSIQTVVSYSFHYEWQQGRRRQRNFFLPSPLDSLIVFDVSRRNSASQCSSPWSQRDQKVPSAADTQAASTCEMHALLACCQRIRRSCCQATTSRQTQREYLLLDYTSLQLHQHAQHPTYRLDCHKEDCLQPTSPAHTMHSHTATPML